MSFSPPKKSSWPKRSAIVISDSPNVHMLLRELLKSYSWTVVDSTPSVEKAVAAVRQGLAFMIIVDDTPEGPAIARVRYLLTDPVAVATPTLCFLMDHHKYESTAIAKIGRPELVEKPLTPSKFVPGFTSLVRRWETGPFLVLRKATYQFINGNNHGGMRILLKLKDIDALRHIVACSLSLHLRRIGKVKESEKILLQALKVFPRDLGTMIVLGDLYMHVAMPALASRLFAGARTAFGPSLAVVPDLVQAAIQQGQLKLAIDYLYHLHRQEFLPTLVPQFLARLLFAEGREQEAERVLNNNRVAFGKIHAGWINAEIQPEVQQEKNAS